LHKFAPAGNHRYGWNRTLGARVNTEYSMRTDLHPGVMSEFNLQLVKSNSLSYLLSVPDMMETALQLRPLLCFLHGYDEGNPTPIREALTRHGPLNPARPGLANEFIVLAPQLPVRGDMWHDVADAVGEIVEQVSTIHQIDPGQRFLTGFSFGGNGVFDLALERRDFWAALWAVDPTRVPDEDPGCPVWLSSGEVSRRQEPAFIGHLRLSHLEGGLAGERVYVDQGKDHVGTATLAYRDERIYRWLLSQRLPSASD
jgi:predicted peptidase